MKNEPLYRLLEARRSALGLSQAQVSDKAFGRPDSSAMQNIRRGASPSIEKVAALCSALGLELYIGPPRGETPADPSKPVAGHIRYGGQDLTIICEKRVNPRGTAAGPALVDPPEDGPGEVVAFSRSWLAQRRSSSDLTCLVRVLDAAMAPQIPKGSLVLVNLAEPRVDEPGIFAFIREDRLYVRRVLPIEPDDHGIPAWLVVESDSTDYKTEVIRWEQIRIAGRVRSAIVTFQ